MPMETPGTDDTEHLFRDIVALWESRRPAPDLMPPRSAFDMLDFKDWLGWVSIYGIEYHKAVASGPYTHETVRFKILLSGTKVTIIDKADNTHRYLDDVFPPAKHPNVFSPYFDALSKRGPVHLMRTVPTVHGTAKTLAKLVLPVSDDGRTADKFINILHYSAADELFEIEEALVI